MPDNDQWTVTLKNGEHVDCRRALMVWHDLEEDVSAHQLLTSILFEHVSHGTALSQQQLDALGMRFLLPDGSVDPVVKALVQSGVSLEDGVYQASDPFADDPRTQEVRDKTEDMAIKNIARFLRKVRSERERGQNGRSL